MYSLSKKASYEGKVHMGKGIEQITWEGVKRVMDKAEQGNCWEINILPATLLDFQTDCSKQSHHIIICIFSFKSFRAVYCTEVVWFLGEYISSHDCNEVYMQSESQPITNIQGIKRWHLLNTLFSATNVTCP